MLDLLAAISSVDPPSFVAWAVLVFAAGMYPVGIMLGSTCSSCCGNNNNPCTACIAGALPDTLTVSIGGYVDGQTQGPDIAPLAFSSNFGSGASGKVTAPGGNPNTDKGPVSAVSLISGGEGYAREVFARSQPTIAASASGGTGATFNVSLFQYYGEQKWGVDSVAVTNGGSGYPDGAAITFTPEAGAITEEAAYATAIVGRAAPTVTASASGGTGAALSVTLSQENDWYSNQPYWIVSGVSVTNGGTGYTDGDPVTFTVTDGTSNYGASATISVTDGEITGVNLDYYGGGYYFKSTGIITGVTFGFWGGGGGSYYKETFSGVETATVTVTVSQSPPIVGATGAVLSAVIDDDTESETFGQITSVEITNGGSGYLAWMWQPERCCAGYWNNKSIVLKRSAISPCEYGHSMCGQTCGAGVTVAYEGPGSPPIVFIDQAPFWPTMGECGTSYIFLDEPIANCSDFSGSGTHPSGVTVQVSAGGEYDPSAFAGNGTGNCFSCCQAEEDSPQEVSVEVREWVQGADDWGPPVGMEEVPEVVLQRGGFVPLLAGPVCAATWSAPLPNGTTVAVFIETCRNKYKGLKPFAGQDGVPAQCGGGGCRDCETRAAANVTFGVVGGSIQDRGYSDPCAQCKSGAMCAPEPGEYEITESVASIGGFLNQTKLKITVL